MPSSSIRKTEHDPNSRILSVWFVASGKRYEFEDVPPAFAAFRAAFAKGRYFNDHPQSLPVSSGRPRRRPLMRFAVSALAGFKSPLALRFVDLTGSAKQPPRCSAAG
ncbi:KTSC domain-containing protein [Mesorhizobium sp. M0051]|uniref:KTSC domain-containing protein n=1 Tax=Mesorhizobium sp. M0051 TaxID=2956862 RepID=UPI003337A905